MVRKPDSAPCGNFLAGVTRGWRAAKMTKVLDPFRFVLITVAGWMNQRQLQMIDYLREENRILREQLAGRRLRLNDDQRRRFPARAKQLGRKCLADMATILYRCFGHDFLAMI